MEFKIKKNQKMMKIVKNYLTMKKQKKKMKIQKMNQKMNQKKKKKIQKKIRSKISDFRYEGLIRHINN